MPTVPTSIGRRALVRAGLATTCLLATCAIALALAADLDIAACRTRTSDRIGTLPHRHAALVLGTSRRDAHGHVNGYFASRMTAAWALWSAGKVDVLLVSGDNGHRGYDEPGEMKSALVALGVPASAIVCDYAGFRTLDSVVRLQAVFGQSSAIVVSQQFHNERAIYIAGQHGIDLIGLNAADVDLHFGLKTRIREFAARVACLIDTRIRHAGPHFYGDPIRL